MVSYVDWAVQNQKLESAKFLIDNFVGLDVLQQNASGRGALTDAFQTGNVELINLCLSHPSSSEDKLLDKMDSENVKLTDNTVVAGADETQSITHEFTLSVDPLYDGKTVFIRELPIKNPDNPFGTDTAPEDDTTGLLTSFATLTNYKPCFHSGAYFEIRARNMVFRSLQTYN